MQKFLIVMLVAWSVTAQAGQIQPAPTAALFTAATAAAGCLVTNMNLVGDPSNIANYVAVYDPSCTAPQIAAGNATIAAFDLAGWLAVHPPRKVPPFN
jgi:hypothetical protein